MAERPTYQENTYLRGSITVHFTLCLFNLDSVDLFLLNEKQFYLFGQIQISQTGGQPFSDTFPWVFSAGPTHR